MILTGFHTLFAAFDRSEFFTPPFWLARCRSVKTTFFKRFPATKQNRAQWANFRIVCTVGYYLDWKKKFAGLGGCKGRPPRVYLTPWWTWSWLWWKSLDPYDKDDPEPWTRSWSWREGPWPWLLVITMTTVTKPWYENDQGVSVIVIATMMCMAMAMINMTVIFMIRDETSQNLSGGMQRKLSIACAFVGGSKWVLIRLRSNYCKSCPCTVFYNLNPGHSFAYASYRWLCHQLRIGWKWYPYHD